MTDLSWARPKLAELCRLEKRFGNERHPLPNDETVFGWFDSDGEFVCFRDSWRPDDDVAQAIRCLESLPKKWSGGWKLSPSYEGGVICSLNSRDLENVWKHDMSFPKAIVLAIIAALDLKP